jgi:hypothetical protein
MFVLYEFIFQVLIFVFQQGKGVFIVVFNFLIFGQYTLNLHIFRIDDFLKFTILVVQRFDLVEVLLLQVLNFRVEVIVKFVLEPVDLFLVLAFLIKQISS